MSRNLLESYCLVEADPMMCLTARGDLKSDEIQSFRNGPKAIIYIEYIHMSGAEKTLEKYKQK